MKKIILALVLLGSLTFGITFSKEQVKEFEQNCEAGDFEACSYAGALYKDPTEFGRNASDRDYKKTLYFYEKACDGNVYEACSDLGTMYFDGKGVKKDYKKAAEIFNKACDGDAGSCSNLGIMYATGKGVKMDITRAMGYYIRACDAGVWIACGNLASVLEACSDKARAVQYYKKACELGRKEEFLSNEDRSSLQMACDKYDILK